MCMVSYPLSVPPSRVKGLKTETRFDKPFYKPMILLNNVIQILFDPSAA